MLSACSRNRKINIWIALTAIAFLAQHTQTASADPPLETTSSRSRGSETIWTGIVSSDATQHPNNSAQNPGKQTVFSSGLSWPEKGPETSSRKKENNQQPPQTDRLWGNLPESTTEANPIISDEYSEWPRVEKWAPTLEPPFSGRTRAEPPAWPLISNAVSPIMPPGQASPLTDFWQKDASLHNRTVDSASNEQTQQPSFETDSGLASILAGDVFNKVDEVDTAEPAPSLLSVENAKTDLPLTYDTMADSGSTWTVPPPSYVLAPIVIQDAIEIQTVESVQSQQVPTEPIEILPIERSKSSDTSTPLTSLFQTEKYIGPLSSAENLFSDLNIEAPFQSIDGEISPEIRATRDLDDVEYTWMPGLFTWASPNFSHRPLYFEQVNLERYGIGPKRILQPICSGMHFFGSIAIMPCKLLSQHPHERVYSLGHQRPGDPVAYQGRPFLGQSSVGEVRKYWETYSGYQ